MPIKFIFKCNFFSDQKPKTQWQNFLSQRSEKTRKDSHLRTWKNKMFAIYANGNYEMLNWLTGKTEPLVPPQFLFSLFLFCSHRITYLSFCRLNSLLEDRVQILGCLKRPFEVKSWALNLVSLVAVISFVQERSVNKVEPPPVQLCCFGCFFLLFLIMDGILILALIINFIFWYTQQFYTVQIIPPGCLGLIPISTKPHFKSVLLCLRS